MRDAGGGSALQASSGSARGTGGAGGLRQRGTMRDACGVTVWQSPAGRAILDHAPESSLRQPRQQG